jgi:hypothetical protein
MADEEDDENQQPIYDDDENEGGVFRWMSVLVVILAVAGFFGLAWYAYRNGGETVDEKDVELIKADKTPVKEAPANPGGMQIPNQDKTVYGLISGKTEKPVVERILPAPEEPMPRASGDTETWMSDSLKHKIDGGKTAGTQVIEPNNTTAEALPKEQFNPAKVRDAAIPAPDSQAAGALPSVAPSVQVAAATPKALPVIPPASSAPPVPAVAPAQPKATAPAAASKPAANDSDEDEEKKPATPPASVAAPPAGIRVQLGAYKSQGEAESNWARIAHKFSDDMADKQHYIVRADLGGKGVFYRLQLAPFPSSGDAEQFCLDFVSAGQGCIVAQGK